MFVSYSVSYTVRRQSAYCRITRNETNQNMMDRTSVGSESSVGHICKVATPCLYVIWLIY
jgi:hypothetical protein